MAQEGSNSNWTDSVARTIDRFRLLQKKETTVEPENNGDTLALDARITCEICGEDGGKDRAHLGQCEHCIEQYRPLDYADGQTSRWPEYAGL